MIFADLFFIYVFLPIFGILYGIAYAIEHKKGNTTLRNTVLILFSLLFYVWGEPVYILLLLFCVLIAYVCARTHLEVLGIILTLLGLAVFKYGNMVLPGILSLGVDLPVTSIRLPIGISFFTFQSISYLADVKAGRYEPQKKFFDLLLYIIMFPQLIAGPIVRYSEISVQIRSRKVTTVDLAEGIQRFVIGLSKKVIIADQLSSLTEQTLGGDLSLVTPGMAWLGLLAFSLQIYFDFSGYSDMAIGMGRCMGFDFPENFDHPYLCRSVTDFWRRWHMTLGRFFRDYVYIPLGGNRCGKLRWVRNILIVWGLTGFWHGASFNFLIWGLYFGILLLLERIILFRGKKTERGGIIGFVFRLISLLLVVLGWGIFYFEDFSRMGRFFRILSDFAHYSPEDYLTGALLTQNMFLLGIAVLFCFRFPKTEGRFFTVLKAVLSVALLLISTVLLVGATNHPFLYTRF